MDQTLFDGVKGGFSNTAGSRGDIVDGQLYDDPLDRYYDIPFFSLLYEHD